MSTLAPRQSEVDAPSLQKWLYAVSTVEKSQIIPPGLDCVSSGEDRAKIAAFFGDRKFHGFVATALESHVGRKNGTETLSEVSNVCVSNKTFQFFLGMILPIQSKGILETAMNQEHNSATMVKAAIDAVLQRGTNDASEAVQELADFLVMQGPQLLSKFGNAKGALIQHVAKYYPVVRNTTAGDHAPSFESKAVLPDAKGNRELPQDLFPGEIGKCFIAIGIGFKKKTAEQDAAKRLILMSGMSNISQAEERIEGENSVSSGENVQFVLKPEIHSLAMTLKNNESRVEYWERHVSTRKNLIHMVHLVPAVYSKVVTSTNAWHGGDIGRRHSCLIVAVSEDVEQVFYEHGDSGRAARENAALLACQYIQSLVGPK
jgi:hypothetical protein